MKEARDQIAKGAADTPPDRTEINYEVKLKSHDTIIFGDGDQGSVSLIIYGDNGSSGSIEFRSDDNDAKKYDGQSITFKKKTFDAGKMTKIALICSNIEAWPLDSIEVTDNKRKTKIKFLLPQPIDATTTIIDLYPEGSIVQTATDLSARDEKKNKAQGTLVSRQSPQTTKRPEQGATSTRAGEGNKKPTKTDESKTKPSKADDQKSKAAKADGEKTPKKDSTPDKKPTPAASTVNEPTPAASTVVEPPPPEQNKNIEYTITVQTGSVQFAGTDAKVYLTLNGDQNNIARYQLKNSTQNRNPFEKDQKDEFVFENIDIGQLKTIIIEHDDAGMNSGWFLDYVQVTYNNNAVMFPVERWLANDKDDKRISLELEPNTKPSSIGSVENGENEKHPSISSSDKKERNESPLEGDQYDDFFDDDDEETKEPGTVDYEIIVKTADKTSAGTDSDVYLTIFGDKDKIEARQLKEPLDGIKDPFEAGSINRFQFNALDVGKIERIRIEHNNKGMASGWYLDSIEIRHISRNETYQFPVDRWLDVNEGDKRIALDLEPDKKPGQLGDENDAQRVEENTDEEPPSAD